MADTRKGLNGSFSYTLPTSNAAQVYRVRVLACGYGAQQLASETMSRTRRAFYPRNVVSTPFFSKILLKGVGERASFSNYIQNYANNYLAPESQFPPIMTFTCSALGLSQTGIPTDGFEWGNSVGAMIWTPTIRMQPTDSSFTPTGTQRTGGVGISNLDQASYQAALKNAPELAYFIPEGIQLSGDQAPPSGNWNTSDSGLSPAAVDAQVSGVKPPAGTVSLPTQTPAQVAKGLGGV